MKIIKMNIKRYKEIIRKKDILTRALSEARKLNKSIIWEGDYMPFYTKNHISFKF